MSVLVSHHAVSVSLSHLPQKPLHYKIGMLNPCLSWVYIRLLLLIGVSRMIQAAALVLLVFTRVLVLKDIKMGSHVLEIIGVGLFIGSMVGGPIFGQVADRFGRRNALTSAMVFSLAGLAVSAHANNEFMMIFGRVITGFGFGGQLASTFVLVQELTPQSMSGCVVALVDAFTGLGGLVGVILAYAVAPQLEWRTTYSMTSGLALYAFVLCCLVPESPRWLVSVGRTEEALAILEKNDQFRGALSIERDDHKPELRSNSVQDSPTLVTKSSRSKRLTFMLWILWIITTLSSYALGIYVPTLISINGYNLFARWTTISMLQIAQVVGSVAAASVLDAYGSHRCFAAFATLAATLSILLSYMAWSRAVVISFSFVVAALLSACWSCIFTYTPVQFKLTHRGRGMGYAVGVSRLAAVGGCYLYSYMDNTLILSVSMLCWIFGGLLMIVAVLIGMIPSFGYQLLAQEDDTSLCTSTSIAELEKNVPMKSKENQGADEKSVVATQSCTASI